MPCVKVSPSFDPVFVLVSVDDVIYGTAPEFSRLEGQERPIDFCRECTPVGHNTPVFKIMQRRGAKIRGRHRFQAGVIPEGMNCSKLDGFSGGS